MFSSSAENVRRSRCRKRSERQQPRALMTRCCPPSLSALLDFFTQFYKPRMAGPTQFTSFLEVVNYCDDFPLPGRDIEAYVTRVNSLYHFKVSPHPITLGFVLPEVARRFASCPGWETNSQCTPRTLTLTGGHDQDSRSAIIAATMMTFKTKKTFQVLENWRGELKTCYGSGGRHIFSIERAAVPLLGIVAYGVMLLAYTYAAEGAPSLWVQRRSERARTHAGMLDGTVAGGMGVGSAPFATLMAEAEEEASFPTELVRQRARACGTLSYFHTRKKEMRGEVGLLQPGVHFLYDMEVPQGVEPRSNDMSVAGFELMTPERVKGEILAGHVKPWFALAVIDFFVRHGIVNEENERDFVEISMRLHRNLEFPVFGVSFLSDR